MPDGTHRDESGSVPRGDCMDRAPLPIPVADLHCDTVLELQGGADVAGNPGGHVDIPRLRRGGVGLQVFAAFVSATLPEGRAFAEANALLDLLDAACEAHPGDLVRARTADEVRRVVGTGATAAVAAVESGHAIEGDLGKLQALARRGVRYMTLTHTPHLPWAASSGDEGEGPGGLTAFGRDVVAAMNDLRVIVDVSHVHERTFWDVVRVARRPFMASHSCASALCPMPRNLTDEQIRAIGESGGVVGVNFFPAFLDPRYLGKRRASMEALFAELETIERETLRDPGRRNAAIRNRSSEARAAMGPPEADLDTLCDHLDHVAEVAGDDAVAFGSDFDGVTDLPVGIGGCEAFPAILARLRGRGWDEVRLRKLAWDNFMRVLEATE
jgi:membrane dipeptidase